MSLYNTFDELSRSGLLKFDIDNTVLREVDGSTVEFDLKSLIKVTS